MTYLVELMVNTRTGCLTNNCKQLQTIASNANVRVDEYESSTPKYYVLY